MATMIATIKVKDFGHWKKVFDSQKSVRSSYGAVSAKIYQQDGETKNVTIVFGWDSIENAKKFARSSELKDAMEQAGVLSPPEIHFLNEI